MKPTSWDPVAVPRDARCPVGGGRGTSIGERPGEVRETVWYAMGTPRRPAHGAARGPDGSAAMISIAQARELSQAAALNLDNDPELTILLSQQAIEAWKSASQEIPPDLEETLHKAVQNARALYTWDVDAVAIDVGFDSKTGHPYMILADNTSDTIQVWNPILDEKIFTLVFIFFSLQTALFRYEYS